MNGGERMKKKLLGAFVSLFAIVMLGTPVMAAPAERIPVLATFEMGPTHRGEVLISDDVSHQFGSWKEGTVTLTIDGLTLEGECKRTYNTQYNRKTKVLIGFEDVVFTFPDGTFEGNRWRKDFNFTPPKTMDWKLYHCTMHGTGAFRGITLKFSYDGPPNGDPWEGIAIMPKN